MELYVGSTDVIGYYKTRIFLPYKLVNSDYCSLNSYSKKRKCKGRSLSNFMKEILTFNSIYLTRIIDDLSIFLHLYL